MLAPSVSPRHLSWPFLTALTALAALAPGAAPGMAPGIRTGPAYTALGEPRSSHLPGAFLARRVTKNPQHSVRRTRRSAWPVGRRIVLSLLHTERNGMTDQTTALRPAADAPDLINRRVQR